MVSSIHIKRLYMHFLCFKLDEFRLEIQRRDQEIMAMAAKMKTLEEQHQVIHNYTTKY